jgi:hypothetical protein
MIRSERVGSALAFLEPRRVLLHCVCGKELGGRFYPVFERGHVEAVVR